MHIHGNPINLNLAHLHSAGAAEKAAATQRAAEVRKKLSQGSAQIADESHSEAVAMVGGWSDGGSQDNRHPQHQSASSSAARQPANDQEPGAHPVSIWA